MKILFYIGVRNLWRNYRRTLMTLIVLTVAHISIVLVDSFSLGTTRTMIDTITHLYMGHGQIHHKDYPATKDLNFIIEDPHQVYKALNNIDEIESFTPRVFNLGMISSSYDVATVQFVGIDYDTEKKVSKIKDSIILGDYPRKEDRENSIIIGSKLAKNLEITIGDKVVVTLTTRDSGELIQEMFRIKSIVHFNARAMDSFLAFLDIGRMQNLIKQTNGIHEVALKLKSRDENYTTNDSLWKTIQFDHLTIEPWYDLLPSLKAIIEMNQYGIIIISGILFILVFLTIMNTLFMSIFERLFEFGVIKALGTKPWQISLIIIFEALSLGLIGSLLGCFFGFFITYYFSIYGISYAELEMSGANLMDPIKTILKPSQFVLSTIILIAMTLISSIYPAIFAARIVPSEAMKKTL